MTVVVGALNMQNSMIPAGYMAKVILKKPDWLKANGIEDIYSVSDCISKPFTDFIDYWKHNGFWLFDSPRIIEDLSKENSIALETTKLFYYDVYELEFYEDAPNWRRLALDRSFHRHVISPKVKLLEGFDIATFSVGAGPECSPLSCNSLATEIRTNRHCLIETLENAKQSLEVGKFQNSEPGPFRVFGVYSTEWP